MEDNSSVVLDEATIEEVKAMMKDKFPTMLEYYIEDIQSYLEQLEQGFSDGDMQVVIAPAHTIKSSSKQMGAMKLSAIAKEIETLARTAVDNGSGVDVIKDLVPEARHAFEEVCPELEVYR